MNNNWLLMNDMQIVACTATRWPKRDTPSLFVHCQLLLVDFVIAIAAIASDANWTLGTTAIAEPIRRWHVLALVTPFAPLPDGSLVHLACEAAVCQNHTFGFTATKAQHTPGSTLVAVVAGSESDVIDENKAKATPLSCCCFCHDECYDRSNSKL
jgi:hypothetical protein